MSADGDDQSVIARGLLDRFTDVDSLLRDLRDNTLAEAVGQLQAQTTLLSEVAEAGGIDVGEIEPTASREFTLAFGENIPADTQPIDAITQTRTVDFDGRIRGFVAVFPGGAQQAAGIQIARAGGEKLFPRNDENDFLGLDNITQEFSLDVPVAEDEQIEILYANTDTSEDHFINGGLFIEEGS